MLAACALPPDISHCTPQPPKVKEIRKSVLGLLKKAKKSASAAVFWGRERYVRILWPYIERNLRVNKGILEEVVLITHSRDTAEGWVGSMQILEDAVAKYPGVVKHVEFCPTPYGECWSAGHQRCGLMRAQGVRSTTS